MRFEFMVRLPYDEAKVTPYTIDRKKKGIMRHPLLKLNFLLMKIVLYSKIILLFGYHRHLILMNLHHHQNFYLMKMDLVKISCSRLNFLATHSLG